MKTVFFAQIVICLILSIQIPAQDGDFKTFIKEKGSKLADYQSECEHFFGIEPYTDESEGSYYQLLIVRDNFVGILFTTEQYDAHNETIVTLSTYDWDGNFIDKIDYGYSVGGDFYAKSITCELVENDNINCTTAESEGTLKENLDENGNVINMEYVIVREDVSKSQYKLNTDGTFEEIIITNE